MVDLACRQWGADIYQNLPLGMRALVEWQAGYIASGGDITNAIKTSGNGQEI